MNIRQNNIQHTDTQFNDNNGTWHDDSLHNKTQYMDTHL